MKLLALFLLLFVSRFHLICAFFVGGQKKSKLRLLFLLHHLNVVHSWAKIEMFEISVLLDKALIWSFCLCVFCPPSMLSKSKSLQIILSTAANCINFFELEMKHLFNGHFASRSQRKVLRETLMYKSSYMILLCRFLSASRQFDWIFHLELQRRGNDAGTIQKKIPPSIEYSYLLSVWTNYIILCHVIWKKKKERRSVK